MEPYVAIACSVFDLTSECKGLDAQSWKDLYHAAMCESDVNKLPERIAASVHHKVR